MQRVQEILMDLEETYPVGPACYNELEKLLKMCTVASQIQAYINGTGQFGRNERNDQVEEVRAIFVKLNLRDMQQEIDKVEIEKAEVHSKNEALSAELAIGQKMQSDLADANKSKNDNFEPRSSVSNNEVDKLRLRLRTSELKFERQQGARKPRKGSVRA